MDNARTNFGINPPDKINIPGSESLAAVCGLFCSFGARALDQRGVTLAVTSEWCHREGAGPTLDNLRTTSLLPLPTALERRLQRRRRSVSSCNRTQAEKRRLTVGVGGEPEIWSEVCSSTILHHIHRHLLHYTAVALHHKVRWVGYPAVLGLTAKFWFISTWHIYYKVIK